MKNILIVLSALSLFSAQAEIFRPTGRVEFTAKGFPTFITIKGVGEGLTGSMEVEGKIIKEAIFTFPLKTLKTGMDLRDEHMHEKYLETQKYPLAKLILPSFELKDSGTIQATLKLHNVEKEIEVHYEASKSDKLKVTATFQIILADFGIEIPSFQGITVAKEISLAVNLTANKK